MSDPQDDELARALGYDPDAEPTPERVAAVRAAATRVPAQRSRRRFLLTGGIAAGVGAVAGYLVHDTRDSGGAEEPAAVPMEQITFTGSPGVETSALINHTWGTELVLDLTGLAAGTSYDVVFETVTGPVGAGSLLAVPDVVMKCRFGAAPLRADVRAIEVRDPDGAAVLRSELA